MQGRHMGITILFSVQNGNSLIPAIRQQAHFIIYLDQQAFVGFNKNNATGISAQTVKKHAENLLTLKKNYVKLLHDRINDTYHYVKAELLYDYMFNCGSLRRFCQQVSKVCDEASEEDFVV